MRAGEKSRAKYMSRASVPRSMNSESFLDIGEGWSKFVRLIIISFSGSKSRESFIVVEPNMKTPFPLGMDFSQYDRPVSTSGNYLSVVTPFTEGMLSVVRIKLVLAGYTLFRMNNLRPHKDYIDELRVVLEIL